MIAPQIVAEVRRLLAERKHSHREIAHRTGTCRGTVGAIASGRRPDYEPPDEDEGEEPAGPPRRCPNCGGLVCVPCRLCRVRKTIAAGRRLAPRRKSVEIGQPLELDLRPEHRTRFEDVRTRRRESDELSGRRSTAGENSRD